ncbi:acyltransferase family protein [Synoicihabitans lomoniglobus]|uniref:Acyltransferase n=1 Tax=Synoicihabitans lomoniglobus TaxID=2909285 RepID=A0AAF0CLS7_9BACT|nr:acyltransferase [Opitutaceae bacterium LMO-M01]WED63198.1 acyltransferase [Opitutaceae bacterium LMO-M01]
MSDAGRLASIDALRGVAVLGVVTMHCSLAVPSIGWAWMQFFAIGQYGVDLFFAISGFVLCEAVERRRRRGDTVSRREFLWRRGVRLWPLYAAGIWFYGWVYPQNSFSAAQIDDFGGVIGNLLLFNGWQLGWENLLVPGGWSISAEATYALLFAALLPWLRSIKTAVLAWTVAVGIVCGGGETLRAWLVSSAVGGSDAASGYWAGGYMPTFLGGVIVWFLSRRAEGRTLTWRQRGMGAGMAALLFAFRDVGPDGEWQRVIWIGAASALAVWAVADLAVGGWPGRALVGLGQLSYGAYLVHFAMIDVVEVLVVAGLPVGASSGVMFGLMCVGVVAFTMPVAWLVEQVVSPRMWRELIVRLRAGENPAP